MYQSNVQVPHEFFKKSKNEYSNWRFAFFRELIQNSVDADSTEIRFNISELNNELVVECHDNGIGMDSDILINKLLCLGGSHKKDGAIGGFGYAKTLLFFAHIRYEIKTKTFKVSGSGGYYTIEDGQSYVDGTYIKVFMDRENYHYPVNNFLRRLEELMNFSDLKGVAVYANGEKLESNFDKFSYSYPTPIGELKFSDSDRDYSELWVRINGVPMFRHFTSSDSLSNFSGVIELTVGSLEALTSNRDSLKNKSSLEFNKIFESLQKERSSLKKSKHTEMILNVNNDILYYDEARAVDVDYSSDLKHPKSISVAPSDNVKGNDDFTPELKTPSFNPFASVKDEAELLYKKLVSARKKVLDSKYPENFVILLEGDFETPAKIKDSLNQKRYQKLASDWQAAVLSVLYALGSGSVYGIQRKGMNYFYRERPISLGFCFSSSAQALNKSSQEGYKILLNASLFLKNESQLRGRKLLDLAIHELTHLYQDYHDESFLSLESEIKKEFYTYQSLQDINLARLKKY